MVLITRASASQVAGTKPVPCLKNQFKALSLLINLGEYSKSNTPKIDYVMQWQCLYFLDTCKHRTDWDHSVWGKASLVT